jgi:PAS domain S-box-containing protein
METVLIIEDRESDRELLGLLLRHAGYEVLEAASGESGIEIARSEHVHLIMADIVMPTMDGYELVRALRADPITAEIPVVFCTATYAVEEVRRLAAACGVHQILIKPYEPESVVRIVGEALERIPTSFVPLAPEEFHREHLRILNSKLVQKVDELEDANHRSAESLTLFETLLTTAPVGFGFVDRDYRLRQMNETLAAFNRAPLADQLGRSVRDLVPALWANIEPAFRSVLDTGEAVLNHQQESVSADAPEESRVWLSSYYPVSLGGEIIGIGMVVVDITDRRATEELRSIVLENMAEGVYVLDHEDRVMLLNAAGSKMLGWTEDELRGKLVHPAIHYQHADGAPYPADECALLKARTEGRAIRMLDDAFTRRDGSIMPVAYSAAPLRSGANARGTVVVFRDTTAEQTERDRVNRELESLTWVGRIRDALDDGRMVLYSQPIIPLTGGPPCEELLLRMVDRGGEIILPGSFLPTAEKYGLIGEIDRWVVAQAIRMAAGGRRLEVNLSAGSICDPALLLEIREQLDETRADPGNVIFEITETALMQDIDAGETFARGLRDMGCGVALDDFGTGFGSFTYLKRLPIQFLKIDIEFVRDLIPNAANQHVVKAIVSLAEGFGQQTIAEGVEDAETLELLRDYGVDFAQGYHVGRPAAVQAPGQSHPFLEASSTAWARS